MKAASVLYYFYVGKSLWQIIRNILDKAIGCNVIYNMRRLKKA